MTTGQPKSHHSGLLVVDAANVVGSRPNGWWRDRAAAAAALCGELTSALDAGRLTGPVVVVVEGEARAGVEERDQQGLRVIHAPGSGDDTLAGVVAQAVADGRSPTLVTADRELRQRAQQAGGVVAGPRWLLQRL